MIAQYHILNGDALLEQFPNRITGEIIVCRECLVDGPVDGKILDELFETRANFIATSYGGFSKEEYYDTTVLPFKLIQEIPSGSEINLWFEEDLFCQVNLWFVCTLLEGQTKNCAIKLVRPEATNPYSFGEFSELELVSLYDKRKPFKEIDKLADLWRYYQQGKTEEMLSIGREFAEDLPFLLPAIEAHIDRIPSDIKPGRPTQTLMKIKEDLATDDFGMIFREFNKREPIYGFGDLQVKRLWDQLSRK